MNVNTGQIYEPGEILMVPTRDLPRVRAMSVAERQAYAAAKTSRREASRRARKARRKTRVR